MLAATGVPFPQMKQVSSANRASELTTHADRASPITRTATPKTLLGGGDLTKGKKCQSPSECFRESGETHCSNTHSFTPERPAQLLPDTAILCFLLSTVLFVSLWIWAAGYCVILAARRKPTAAATAEVKGMHTATALAVVA